MNTNEGLSLIELVDSGKLWDIPGGIHPPEKKHISTQQDISKLPEQDFYYLTVKQHIGVAANIICEVGQKVLVGEPLTKGQSDFALPIHAPVSGEVVAVQDFVSAHPSGLSDQTIIIKNDRQQQLYTPSPLNNWQQLSNDDITQQIKDMGVAGLGGAAFPTHIKGKAKQNIDLLIINGVECEPYITADDMLMRSYAQDIITGAQILAHISAVKKIVIAIEDNKPEAIAAMQIAAQEHNNVDVRAIKTKYPSGGEKQLIQIITGLQVPSGKLPAELGIIMQNVATCFSVKQAVIDGVALTQRVITITGESVRQPQNMWVPLGTPVNALLDHCGFMPEQNKRVVLGGPMMGFAISDHQTPVVKATNCVLALDEVIMPEPQMEQACIRCGDCAVACPVDLQPQQLLWHSKAKDHQQLQDHNLQDCIECGACAYVCPSQIPLVQYYRQSKADLKEAEQERLKSEKAKIRFEQRQQRLEKQKQQRAEKHKAAAEKRKQAMANDSSAKDKIAAALARAQAKKAQSQTSDDVNDTADKQDKVAQAIARAKAKKAQQNSTDSQSQVEPSAVEDSKKDKVAAAIARAKAKKAQQNDENVEVATDANVNAEEKSAEQTKKDKVAAAIARAKAKKAQQKDENVEVATDADVNAEEKSAEQTKKDKVAAAIARAKAKKTQQKDENVEVATDANVNAEEKSAEQIKKDKVAAAIARAKAKKAQQNDENVEVAAETDVNAEEKSAEQIKKDKVAAAIARAKAKKLQKESQQDE